MENMPTCPLVTLPVPPYLLTTPPSASSTPPVLPCPLSTPPVPSRPLASGMGAGIDVAEEQRQ